MDILEKAKIAIEDGNPVNLNDLSNRTIHTASIEQDTDSVILAVIIYSLSKIIERGEYKNLLLYSRAEEARKSSRSF